VGGRKSPFPITLAIGLYNSLYYRTCRDIEFAFVCLFVCLLNACSEGITVQLLRERLDFLTHIFCALKS